MHFCKRCCNHATCNRVRTYVYVSWARARQLRARARDVSLARAQTKRLFTRHAVTVKFPNKSHDTSETYITCRQHFCKSTHIVIILNLMTLYNSYAHTQCAGCTDALKELSLVETIRVQYMTHKEQNLMQTQMYRSRSNR